MSRTIKKEYLLSLREVKKTLVFRLSNFPKVRTYFMTAPFYIISDDFGI